MDKSGLYSKFGAGRLHYRGGTISGPLDPPRACPALGLANARTSLLGPRHLKLDNTFFPCHRNDHPDLNVIVFPSTRRLDAASVTLLRRGLRLCRPGLGTGLCRRARSPNAGSGGGPGLLWDGGTRNSGRAGGWTRGYAAR